jgi:hypothetical protein
VATLDDLPEKWRLFTEVNASYAVGGNSSPTSFRNELPKKAEGRRPVVGTAYLDEYELPKRYPQRIRVTIEPAE